MPYIGRRMSVNAALAYKKGLLPLSKISKKLLISKGWNYSKAFFVWLCKEKYVFPAEYHHTTPQINNTAFYDLTKIMSIYSYLDLESLYEIYKDKSTAEMILERKGISYVKVLISGRLMGTKNDVIMDCILYRNTFYWSCERSFKNSSREIIIMHTYNTEDISLWNNPNEEQIKRQIIMYKNLYKYKNRS